MRCYYLLVIFLFLIHNGFSQERIESEYKLAVPKNKVSQIWSFLQADSFQNNPLIDSLKSTISIEKFHDIYFDTSNRALLKASAGLRHRTRIVENQPIKKLIQLKISKSLDGVARTEIKFNPTKKKNPKNLWMRHPFLKYLDKKDRENMDFYLVQFGIKSDELTPIIKMNQIRKRIYLSDSKGVLATITLDEVQNKYSPYQTFFEMEMELNEIRYTTSNPIRKKQLEDFNFELKKIIEDTFPSLQQDQRPKYNKLMQIIDESHWSYFSKYWMWIPFSILIFYALFLLIKDNR